MYRTKEKSRNLLERISVVLHCPLTILPPAVHIAHVHTHIYIVHTLSHSKGTFSYKNDEMKSWITSVLALLTVSSGLAVAILAESFQSLLNLRERYNKRM